jgi:hypothetical protein
MRFFRIKSLLTGVWMRIVKLKYTVKVCTNWCLKKINGWTVCKQFLSFFYHGRDSITLTYRDSSDEFLLRLLEAKSEASSARTWEKLFCGGPQTQESCPDQRKIRSVACDRDCKFAILSPSVSSPIEERGKNGQIGFYSGDQQPDTGFLQSSAACHHRNNGGKRIKFLFIQYSKC